MTRKLQIRCGKQGIYVILYRNKLYNTIFFTDLNIKIIKITVYGLFILRSFMRSSGDYDL